MTPPLTVIELTALVPSDILMYCDEMSRVAVPSTVIVAVLLSPSAGSNQLQDIVPPVSSIVAVEFGPYANPPPEPPPREAVPPVIVNVPDDDEPEAK
jgi:hypothetical protein